MGDTDPLSNISKAYLKELILYHINEQITIREEPKWYNDFIKYILLEGKSASHNPLDVEQDIFPNYRRRGPEALTYLRDELSQLHKRGLVLYYPTNMPNDVWLNPEALVTYVHSTIL